MKTFDYRSLATKKWDNEIVGYLSLIHEYKTKQDMFLLTSQESLDKLVEMCKVQSTLSSNEIEGIRTTTTRLNKIMQSTITPKTRDEEEIAGYRDVLNAINENYEYIPLTPNYLLQLHAMLFAHSSKAIGGKFKNVQNYITATDANGNYFTLFTPPAPYETAPAIESLCSEFNRAISEGDVDPLILIPVFIHDFLCIHPFLDGNGRLSRLLTTLLLCKSGYTIGKYISLEAKIAATKSGYYSALQKSQTNWESGENNVEPFIKYLLGTIVAAYRDEDARIKIISDSQNSASMVKSAISTVVGKFTKNDLLSLCPTISIKTIESCLAKLLASGEIKKHSAGKNTYYTVNG